MRGGEAWIQVSELANVMEKHGAIPFLSLIQKSSRIDFILILVPLLLKCFACK